MKHFLSILFILSSFAAFSQTTKKVFFIGNSYTYTNNIPSLINQAAASLGDELIYTTQTPGGAQFVDHAKNSTVYSKLNADDWDFVVLQGQSQEVAWPKDRVDIEVFPYAKQLADSAKAIDAIPIFYMTWGKENGDTYYCNYPYIPEVFCTYEGMDSILNKHYRILGEENQGWVSPVGEVWHYLRDNHPELNLYSSDGSHPSITGSYASAITFFALIFSKDPTTVTFNSSLSDTTANNIKSAVKQIVYNDLSQWKHSSQSITEIDKNSIIHVFPNPVNQFLNLQDLTGAQDVKIYSTTGILVKTAYSNQNQIDVQDLNSGVYILETENTKVKFVKE